MRPFRLFLSLAMLAQCSVTLSQTLSNPNYYWEQVVSGLASPVQFAFVNQNEILVCEKASGIVKRIVNGTYVNDAIDLPVVSNSERGLLGICLDPNFSTNGYVYLYWSRSSTGADSTTSSHWADNRVEKFTYNSGFLFFESTLFVTPTDPSQANGANHDGGIIIVGPDNKLYVMTGDLNRGRFSNPRIEQNTSTTAVAMVGGIVRLNLDGTTPPDNPFFSHSNPDIRKYYAYGIRNSYGMAFDSQTNFLWFTENGPTVYDEINVIPSPGMNSGWLKIMGPDSRNATYVENNLTSYNASDLTVLSGSYYRDPEFSWAAPIGVTGMCFLNSSKFLPAERGDIIVGDTNTNNLYLLPVNAARNGFDLSGGLADKVADSTTERNTFRFGQSWGVAVDLKLGPDGYLYIASYSNGAIYRIRPIVEEVAPITISSGPGATISGGLPEVLVSDDLRWVLRPTAVAIATQPPVSTTYVGTSPFASVSQLVFQVETNASLANIEQRISLKDYITDSFEQVDSRVILTTDSITTVTITSNPGRFINPANREVSARVMFKATGPVPVFPWQARLDKVSWTITKQ